VQGAGVDQLSCCWRDSQGAHNGAGGTARDYGDARLTAGCTCCGRETDTRDHVPARVFLDKRYPDNLPVVAACNDCNQAASKDEEYVACLIECARIGSVDPNNLERDGVRPTLEEKPALAARLTSAQRRVDGGVAFDAEVERVNSVLLKLARGHCNPPNPRAGDRRRGHHRTARAFSSVRTRDRTRRTGASSGAG
jgi:hypothetical protein